MNWDAIGAIGELLGASAVFASLIYLAIQIRGSTNQASAQMFQSAASEQSRVADSITGDPENLKVWMNMHSGGEFTKVEKGPHTVIDLPCCTSISSNSNRLRQRSNK